MTVKAKLRHTSASVALSSFILQSVVYLDQRCASLNLLPASPTLLASFLLGLLLNALSLLNLLLQFFLDTGLFSLLGSEDRRCVMTTHSLHNEVESEPKLNVSQQL